MWVSCGFLQVEKQVSDFQVAMQGPMRSFGEKIGEASGSLQRGVEELWDRSTEPITQVSQACRQC
jgi:hypothetical protein